MRYKIILAAIAATAGLAAATPALARAMAAARGGSAAFMADATQSSARASSSRPSAPSSAFIITAMAIGTVAVIGPSATSTAAAGVIAKR